LAKPHTQNNTHSIAGSHGQQ